MSVSHVLITQDWCHTYTNTKILQLKWTIHNFSYMDTLLDEYITSSEFNFNCNEDMILSGYLKLYTKSEKRRGGGLRVCITCSNNATQSNTKWRATSKLALITAKGNKFAEKVYNFSEKELSVNVVVASFNNIYNEQNNLLPDDNLTLLFEISMIDYKISASPKKIEFEMTETKLNNDLCKLFENKIHADVTLIAAGQEFQGHKYLLASRSKVFAAMFEHKLEESESNSVIIADINPDVLKEMLLYIYTGKAPNLNKMAADLYAASDKYGLENLKSMCEVELKSNISIETAVEILILSDLYNSNDLKDHVIKFINANAGSVVKTEGWQNMVKNYSHLLNDVFLKYIE